MLFKLLLILFSFSAFAQLGGLSDDLIDQLNGLNSANPSHSGSILSADKVCVKDFHFYNFDLKERAVSFIEAPTLQAKLVELEYVVYNFMVQKAQHLNLVPCLISYKLEKKKAMVDKYLQVSKLENNIKGELKLILDSNFILSYLDKVDKKVALKAIDLFRFEVLMEYGKRMEMKVSFGVHNPQVVKLLKEIKLRFSQDVPYHVRKSFAVSFYEIVKKITFGNVKLSRDEFIAYYSKRENFRRLIKRMILLDNSAESLRMDRLHYFLSRKLKTFINSYPLEFEASDGVVMGVPSVATSVGGPHSGVTVGGPDNGTHVVGNPDHSNNYDDDEFSDDGGYYFSDEPQSFQSALDSLDEGNERLRALGINSSDDRQMALGRFLLGRNLTNDFGLGENENDDVYSEGIQAAFDNAGDSVLAASGIPSGYLHWRSHIGNGIKEGISNNGAMKKLFHEMNSDLEKLTSGSQTAYSCRNGCHQEGRKEMLEFAKDTVPAVTAGDVGEALQSVVNGAKETIESSKGDIVTAKVTMIIKSLYIGLKEVACVAACDLDNDPAPTRGDDVIVTVEPHHPDAQPRQYSPYKEERRLLVSFFGIINFPPDFFAGDVHDSNLHKQLYDVELMHDSISNYGPGGEPRMSRRSSFGDMGPDNRVITWGQPHLDS